MRGLWELINWIRKRNFLAVKAIKYNNCLCLEINDLWHAFHFTYNMVQDCHVDIKILEEISNNILKEWPYFLREEFMKAITKYNNLSTPGLDKLLWDYLKYIINNKVCLGKIISITNTCFKLGFWLSHFKSSMIIVIPKPNKESYNFLDKFS